MALLTLPTAHLIVHLCINMYLNTEKKCKLIEDLIQSLLGHGQLFQHLCGALDQTQKEEQDLTGTFNLGFILKKQNNKIPLNFLQRQCFLQCFYAHSCLLGTTTLCNFLKKTSKLSLLA